MKITTESKVINEIEVSFPSSWICKGEHLAPKYYHFISENIGLLISSTGSFDWTPNHFGNEWHKFEPCTPEDEKVMRELFIENQKRHNAIMFPIDATDINLTDNMTEKELINELHRQSGLYGN